MHFLLLLMLLLIFLEPAPTHSACQSAPDPDAVLLEATAEIQILPNGLLMVSYAHPLTNRITHMTLHRVLAILSASPDDDFTQGAVPVILYQSERTGGGPVYAVSANPLYFGTDPAWDGFPACLWADALEDGLNGNEVFIRTNGAVDIVPGEDMADP